MKTIKLISLILCTVLVTSCAALRNADGTVDDTTQTVDVTLESGNTETTETDPEESMSNVASDDATASTTANTHTDESALVSQKTEPSVTSEPTEAVYKPKALMYHLILEEVYGPYSALFVRPADFAEQLDYLDSENYEYLFAHEWKMTARPSVIITLDDGYEDNYTEMFPILKAHGAKATVFLVTELIATDGYLTRDMIREMSDSGLVSFQCHTAHHVDLAYQTEQTVRNEFEVSCAEIKKLTGKEVRAIAYPAGSYNDTVLAVAREFFDFAYTTRSPYNTPDYTDLTVPRYYISRTLGMASFKAMLSY